MIGFAPAKVNLHLHVVGRRADGYHLLDSLAVFAGVGDEVSFAPAVDLSLNIIGPEARALIAEKLAVEPDNLVLRAARALAEAAGIAPYGRLTLCKKLPVASGIGGGSTDAAASLRVLAEAWGIEAVPGLAAGLGADVPVCVERRAALMQGVGEILRPAPALPRLGMVLANPRVALPTPAVFKAAAFRDFSSPAKLPAGWADAQAMAADLARLHNDLEPAAIGQCPAVAEVLAALRALPGVLLARMSGSGATCFALFKTPAVAARAAGELPKNWWSWGGGLYEPARRL